MVPPFFVTPLLFFTLLLTDFGRIGGAAAPAATSLHGRKAQVTSPGTPGTNGGGWQWQGCGPSQCYNQEFGQCFHSTSVECKNPQESTSLVQVTPPPTPRPVVQMIETENPILFRLLNVADDYILSASDRARILSEIRALIDETLDESWELVSVESPGEYIGTRRLQSSLRGGNKRRLNKTLNIPVIVTVRGREDMSDIARLFILQALRNKLNLLLMYLKSLNANAYGSVQLSVEELSLADIGGPIADIGGPIVASLPTLRPTYPPVQSTNTNTESKVETKTSVEATSVEATSPGTPSWVWVIAAAVCIAVGICLLWCICRAGWCLCCADCGGCFKRKRDTKNDYEMQKQLAIERWRQQPVHKKSNDDALGDLIGVSRYGKSNGGYEKRDVYESGRQSDRERRHGDRRRSAPVGGRGHGDRRRRDGKRRRSDGHVLSGNSNRNHQSDRRRPSRPVAKRSLSMIEKELAREEMDVIEEGMKVETERNEPVLAAPPAYPTVTHNQGQDPVAYQNALVVYDDEKARFTLEPEGPKIDDVPKPETAAVVLFNPPKEPEGGLAETPRRKPRNYHHDKDEIYVCSPDELPNYVRDKYGNHTERPQDLPRPSRRKRRSYTDKLKESFSFKRKEGQRNHDDFGDDYDGVQATLGTESDSESRERRRRKSKKKKKKKSNDRSSSHRRHESNGEDRPWIDIANESIPSITTTPPESDHQDDPASRSPRKRSSPRKRMSQSRLFSSFRRFKDGHDLEDLDDESVEHY